MKQGFKKLLALGLIAVMTCGLLAGCGKKASIDLNQYLEIETKGINGSGQVHVGLNMDKMVEDHPDAINRKKVNPAFGDEGAVASVLLALNQYDPFRIVAQGTENCSNGDSVAIDIQIDKANVKTIQQIFRASFRFDPVNYVVEGLREPVDFDPFQDLFVYGFGNSDEENNVVNERYDVTAQLPQEEGEVRMLVVADPDKHTHYHNGDTVPMHVDLEPEEVEALLKERGLRLTRTQAEVTVQGLPYYPREDPSEVFALTTEDMKKYAEESFYDYLKDFQQDDGQVELLGQMYLYNDEGSEREYHSAPNNQTVLFYSIDDSGVEGGHGKYYSYFAPHNSLQIHYQKDENNQWNKVLSCIGADGFPISKYGYESNQDGGMLAPLSVPSTFKGSNKLIYHGFKTLEGAVEGYRENKLQDYRYDHVAVDDNLKALGITDIE